MNRAVNISVMMSLMLIWLGQLAFAPIYLSAVFVLMMLCFIFPLHQWNQTSHLSPNFKTRQHTPKFIIYSLVTLALISIYVSYQSFIGVEAGTAFLAVFLFAKALELKSKRDLIILFNFALFVSASLFLHSQSMWMALLVFLCLVSGLVGLYRAQIADFNVQHNQQQISALHALKTDFKHILKFVGLGIPFFIILFLFFPRFPPLWQVPIATHQGVTGLGDRMSPGDIAELSQSSALAFRILVDLKKLPAQQNLYWRAMVLDQYDGQTWTANTYNQRLKSPNQNSPQSELLQYQYLAADIRQRWVMSLESSMPNERGFSLHEDGAITANRLLQRNQPISLSWLGKITASDSDNHSGYLQPQQYQALASFPSNLDPQAQQLAKQLFQKSDYDAARYVQMVIEWYQKHDFSYSLKPGRLGQHRVDEFLFQSKQGFCEHYASSFVLLMRYVGISARVVVGYQGGQAAPDQKSWEVRQMDAHAWAEVWLDNHWQRIDPTAVIAPQRLDMGMQDYMSNDQHVLGNDQFAQLKYQQFNVLKNLRVWSDYASFQWQDKVLGYDANKQSNWLSHLGFASSYAYGWMIFVAICMIAGLYYVVIRYKQQQQKTSLQKIIARFAKQLSADQQQKTSESFQKWMERLSVEDDLRIRSQRITHCYQKIVYLDQKDKSTIIEFKKMIKEYADALKALKKTCQ